jgi:SHAQKYF class myb-like DNA-binding protein
VPLPENNFEESSTGNIAAGTTTTSRSRRRKRSSVAPTPSSTENSVASSAQQPRGKSRRKANETDARWSKRFTWPEELHRDFVAAIFDVGLKHSSPNSLMEHMPKHEQITNERIKSHLQKYRLHRLKSKKEFMDSYDAGITKLQQHVDSGGDPSASAAALGNLSAGKVASLLAHNTLQGHDVAVPAEVSGHMSTSHPVTVETEDSNIGKAGTTDDAGSSSNSHEFLTLPQLSETEKQSPIGASFGYLMGLFFSLKQQLIMQREAEAAAAAAKEQKDRIAAATDVYDAFVSSGSAAMAASHEVGSGVPSPPSATVVSNPSTRNNLEENNMMKREMQNQMAFQNKMRGLKQQELSKFIDATTTTEGDHQDSEMAVMEQQGTAAAGGGGGTVDHHGTGEIAAGAHGRLHSTSIGNAEDLFHTDLMDEQLFEFLQFD